MRAARLARVVFAATMVLIGCVAMVQGGFAPLWQSVPTSFPGRAPFAELCALATVIPAVGLVWKRTAAMAGRTLLVYLLLWLLLFKLTTIILAPSVVAAYESWGETSVIVAATWILYAESSADDASMDGRCARHEHGVRFARALYGVAMIAFGLSHFFYIRETASLVPAWLPGPSAWAYFTGTAYLGAGIAVLLGVYADVATALSTLQMGTFTLLVWGPVITSGRASAYQWDEAMISLTLTVSAAVVAASYRKWPTQGTRNLQ